MFCANTRPVPDATTDFGEMLPVISCSRTSSFADDGIGDAVGVVVAPATDVPVRAAASTAPGDATTAPASGRPSDRTWS